MKKRRRQLLLEEEEDTQEMSLAAAKDVAAVAVLSELDGLFTLKRNRLKSFIAR